MCNRYRASVGDDEKLWEKLNNAHATELSLNNGENSKLHVLYILPPKN